MEHQELLSHVDHTLLKQTATWPQIQKILDEAMQYRTASACIPPVFVKRAADYVRGKLNVCTVIGFPNGYQTTACKVFEAREAVANGADELDMVINLGMVKEGRFDAVLAEINAVKDVCAGRILKVIVETCFLTEEEKVRMCTTVSRSQADYIKTSTGFGTGGATPADIELFRRNVTNGTKIKAAGGIRSLEDAYRFLELGADRLGTSSVVRLVQNEPAGSY